MGKGASHQILGRRLFGGCHLFGLLLAAAWLLAWASLPAAAQGDGSWQPEAFADYLLSGQTPHPAVVRIVAAEREGASLGSGVLVDANHQQGLVLTNWHVVRDSRSAVLVQFPDGFQTAGTVVRSDETWDLAAVVIWKPPATPVPLAPAAPAPGDVLTIAGYGRGPYRAQTGRCTEYLSPGTGQPKEFVELSAGARQGDSGGPILNERGELAGVLFGQNSGRTIGSCSTRLRVFLASVGSSGFTAAAAAAYADALAIDHGQQSPEQPSRIRMAAATLDGPRQPATEGFASPTEAFDPTRQPPPQNGPFVALPPDATQLASRLVAVFDVSTNGRAMLSAAGGLALVVLGVRTLFGGRRWGKAAPREIYDD